MGRFGKIALAALLASSLVPGGTAFADEPTGAADEVDGAAASMPVSAADGGGAVEPLQLEPGAYVEHEAIAYVMDGGTPATRPFEENSRGSDVLANAETLMDVDGSAAEEALGAEALAVAPASAANGPDDSAYPAGRLVLVRDEGKTAAELIAELEADPRVAFAEPNALVRTDGEADEAAQGALASDAAAAGAPDQDRGGAGVAGAPGQDADDAGAAGAQDAEGAAAAAFAQDSGAAADLSRFLWGFENDGGMAGILASEARDMDYADWNSDGAAGALEEVVVAVVDTGVDAANPDLAPVMWEASPELQQEIGGDKHGFAVGGDEEAGITSYTGMTSYHGTHVAGTIAAKWDGQGVSGLAPNARIMSVRHNNTLSGMILCFDYLSRACAAGVDVRVSNNSWLLGQGQWRSVDIAVTEVGRKGVASFFCAGNSAYDNDAAGATTTTLADNPYAVVVNAANPAGELAVFSESGLTTTDVVAPGSTILSTWATDPARQNYLAEGDADAVLYESFDDASHAVDGVSVGAGGSGASSDADAGGEDAGGEDAGGAGTSGASGGEDASGEDASDEDASDEDAGDVSAGDADASGASGGGASVGTGDSGVNGGDVDAGGVDARAEGAVAGGEYLRFADARVSVAEGAARFDGDAALAVGYDPAELDPEQPFVQIKSEPIDLSAVQEKPQYLSLRYTSRGVDGTSAGMSPALVVLAVKTTDGNYGQLAAREQFGAGGSGWEGCFFALPKNTDWQQFSIGLALVNQGPDASAGAVPGTIYLDSIGLGSDLMPYAYNQGTSMATPAVAGAAAVIAGKGLAEADEPAKAAEKLTTLTQGTAVPDARYEDLCSTGGYASVDGAETPGPVIAKVEDGNGAVAVEGWFMDAGTRVTLGDAEARVTACEPVGADPGNVRLTVEKPAGFEGGQVVVRAEAGGKHSCYRADLGQRIDAAYFDQTNLPVPDELSNWGAWQLVGFAGDVYCLPRALEQMDSGADDHFLRYRPDVRAWEQVPVPGEVARALGVQDAVVDISGATLDGALVLQISDGDTAGFARYTAQGEWEPMGFSFEGDEEHPLHGTLASDGEQVYLFGGVCVPEEEGDYSSADAYRVDFAGKRLEACGTLSTGRAYPQVAYGNGAFVVAGGVNLGGQWRGAEGVDMLAMQDDGKLACTPVDISEQVGETGALAWASAATADGFMLAGPESDDGRADTYTLSADGGLSTYGKRASQQWLLEPSALAYDGNLYVLAATQNEPYRVFSATAVATAPQPGDAVEEVAPEPEPAPEPDPAPPSEGDPGAADGASGEAEALARTGDPAAAGTAALCALAAAACATVAGAVVRRRRCASPRR